MDYVSYWWWANKTGMFMKAEKVNNVLRLWVKGYYTTEKLQYSMETVEETLTTTIILQCNFFSLLVLYP